MLKFSQYIPMLLTEDRLPALYNYFRSLVKQKLKKNVDLTLNNFAQLSRMYDPTPTKKYFQWVINQVVEISYRNKKEDYYSYDPEQDYQNLLPTVEEWENFFAVAGTNDSSEHSLPNPDYYNTVHGAELIRKTLSDFDKVKMRMSEKDINKYTIPELIDNTKEHANQLHRDSVRSLEKKVKHNGTNILQNDDKFLVIEITTPAALELYSKGTKWCTTKLETCKQYVGTGSNSRKYREYPIMIVHKKVHNSRVLISFDLDQIQSDDGELIDNYEDQSEYITNFLMQRSPEVYLWCLYAITYNTESGSDFDDDSVFWEYVFGSKYLTDEFMQKNEKVIVDLINNYAELIYSHSDSDFEVSESFQQDEHIRDFILTHKQLIDKRLVSELEELNNDDEM